MKRVSLGLGVVLLATACGGSTNDSPAGGGGAAGAGAGGSSGNEAIPCGVDAVLEQSCRSCHSSPTKFGAPMPLVTFADLHAPAPSDPSKKVYERVGVRIHDDKMPMPQPPNARLDATATATLDAWIATSAPSGPGLCGAGGSTGTGGSGAGGGPSDPTKVSCTPDVHLTPASAWEMPQETGDVYVCYGFDVAQSDYRQAIAITPRIDNAGIVHHALLFESSTPVSSTPTPCGGAMLATWKMIYAWAPGGQALQLPPEAGYPMASGTQHYVVQVHYNNLQHLAGQKDTSGFDVCTTADARPNEADVVAFGSLNFSIPAHGTQDITCDYTLKGSVGKTTLISAFPHMHKLGTTISTVALPAGGGPPLPMGATDAWDFNNQPWYTLSGTVQGGDTIRTRCAWNNPGDTAVKFGEYTEDEMCYSFTMYYPKLPGIVSWSQPAFQASCKPTK
jgi:hypothetical protein